MVNMAVEEMRTIHTAHKKQPSAEEEKLRQKIFFFCVIFIHFHLFWDHIVYIYPPIRKISVDWNKLSFNS